MFFTAIILAVVAFWILLRLLRPKITGWGATKEEKSMSLPGTEKLRNVRVMDTHGVTIFAPAERIWSFLIQLGQNRGGFYSYRWLENLVGCRMPAVDQIVPELQNLKIGDKVYLHPKAPPLSVSVVEPNRILALEGWYLVLVPKGPNETRLVTRSYDWRDPGRKSKIADFILSGVFFDFAHFIMERKMLLTIKSLAELKEQGRSATWVRPTVAWFGLLILAFVNGAMREFGMKKFMGIEEPLAHQLSCLTGVLLWTGFTVGIWPLLRISSFKQSVHVGMAWLLATMLFETFVLNRNLSYAEILHSYDMSAGEYWGLVLLWVGVMPSAVYWGKR